MEETSDIYTRKSCFFKCYEIFHLHIKISLIQIKKIDDSMCNDNIIFKLQTTFFENLPVIPNLIFFFRVYIKCLHATSLY